jgi:hypothetical protein
MAMLAALNLANCCASGSNCVPVTGGPVAWDGLGAAPTGDMQAIPPSKQLARRRREIIVGPLEAVPTKRNTQPTDTWEQQQAADQDDERKLKRKLTICRTCVTGEPASDDPVSGVSH